MLRDLLDPLVQAVREAVRMRIAGRSRASGTLPAWLPKAADFEIEFRGKDATELVLLAPPLSRAIPEKFKQRDLFEPFDPDACSCIDVFADALDDALSGKLDSDRYDDGLVETLMRLGEVLEHEVEAFELRNGARRPIEKSSIEALERLRHAIPSEQAVRVAGKLDLLQHSTRIFALAMPQGEVRGVLERSIDFDEAKKLLSRDVLVSGVAKFRPSGRVLRVEAAQIAPAEGDLALWSSMPEPLLGELDARKLRVPQGPRTGIAAIFGKWPGDESDDELDEAMRSLS